MVRRMVAALVVFAAMGLGAAPRTWTPEKWFDKPKSPRIANYRIDAVLDYEHKTNQELSLTFTNEVQNRLVLDGLKWLISAK